MCVVNQNKEWKHQANVKFKMERNSERFEFEKLISRVKFNDLQYWALFNQT